MTCPVQSAPPAAAVATPTAPANVEPMEIGKKDSNEVQAMKMKVNAGIQSQVVQTMGNQQSAHVSTARAMQVPQ